MISASRAALLAVHVASAAGWTMPMSASRSQRVGCCALWASRPSPRCTTDEPEAAAKRVGYVLQSAEEPGQVLFELAERLDHALAHLNVRCALDSLFVGDAVLVDVTPFGERRLDGCLGRPRARYQFVARAHAVGKSNRAHLKVNQNQTKSLIKKSPPGPRRIAHAF